MRDTFALGERVRRKMQTEELDGTDESYQDDSVYKSNKFSEAVEASKIYLLMPGSISVSRAARLQWFIDHLDSIVTVSSTKNLYESKDLEIISALPMDEVFNKATRFLVTSNTKIEFLAHSYRFVYCLDMSPSQASVDVLKNELLFDEIIQNFKTSLLRLCEKFTIPGSAQVFQPCIYLTVIVNTPFFISPAQQVLVKGVHVSSRNVQEIIYSVQAQFSFIEERIAHMSAKAYEEIEKLTPEHEDFSNQEIVQNISNIPIVPSDANFVNMLRYSILAISLLPDICLSHIIIITDGVVAMPDSNIMESILFQLHYDSIALSFIKVGPSFSPHVGAGYVSYSDLLHFLSCSTLGTCLESTSKLEANRNMNLYQQIYLLWSFNSKVQFNPNVIDQKPLYTKPNLFCTGIPPLLSKKQAENDVKVPPMLLLYRRLREGYTVNRVSLGDGMLEVRLCRHWKAYIYIQYIMTSPWPVFRNTHYEIHVTAPYDFLHDITCLMKKETKSTYRQVVFEKFWQHLIQLAKDDIVLQLYSFQNSNVWYTLPESVRSGIPLFLINEAQTFDTNKLVLTVNDKSCPKFTSIWQPICQIGTMNWRKWFHVHKVSLILKHDNPLSKYVHLTNPSGRYELIQCRQAVTALYEFLSRWSTFVLIDNHTYLKLIEQKESDQHQFCLIRVTSKFPCTTLTVGFMTGTSGQTRHKLLEELRIELSTLSYLSNPNKKRKKSNCCTLLNKPLEKICIRYERVPIVFDTIIFPDGTQPPHSHDLPVSPSTGTLFTTLSRYLFHQRWIWSGNHPINPKLEITAISRILATITKMRLKEGFNLAHSASGIITMVLELPMNPALSCIVQYVLFPPHDASAYEDRDRSSSEDEQDVENDIEFQIVTEVWIEPQYGRVAANQPSNIKYMENKFYYELSEEIKRSDFNCVNSLLTLEHLSLMCQQKREENTLDKLLGVPPSVSRQNSPYKKITDALGNDGSEKTESVWIPLSVERIQHIPFNFNPINILRICPQTELLFSMFTEGGEFQYGDTDKSNGLLLENITNDLICIHDRELEINQSDSMKFMEQIAYRRVKFNDHPLETRQNVDVMPEGTRWRCFLKGVSVTHVILTFIPASLKDVHDCVLNSSLRSDSTEESNASSVSETSREACTLPMYVYDCPLGLLVDSCMDVHDVSSVYERDDFQDHRFKSMLEREEIITLKAADDDKRPDDKDNAKQHCKTIALSHCKCFASSLYDALHQDLFVHALDVQAVTDQCEETIYKIDITEYLQTVCGHLNADNVVTSEILDSNSCNNLKPIHSLIKEKFCAITNKAFSVIPTNGEFYFSDNLNLDKLNVKTTDSDDEVSVSDVDFKSESNVSGYLNNKTAGSVTSVQMCPLFLHYICTVQYEDYCESTSIKLLPTCVKEIFDILDSEVEVLDKSKLQFSLDILCLTLPQKVQNVINGYSNKGLRTTSFCSDTAQVSVSGSASEVSCNSSVNLETSTGGLANVPDIQRNAIQVLKDEIRWLLKDEIAHSLLDVEPVTIDTLRFVSKHISESPSRESCRLDIIDLNFVDGPTESYERFVQEFGRITVADHKLCQVEDLYYLTKTNEYDEPECLPSDVSLEISTVDVEIRKDDGEEKFQWLLELHKKRKNLPNFWLIMEIHHNAVTIYFHCRYLELQTTHVGIYLKVQRAIHDAIKELCKKVNQYLLLRSLHDKRTCDPLLEPDDSAGESSSNGSKSFSRLKSMEETSDEYDYPSLMMEASLKFKAGYFSCPVVWETHFVLHPRLKTGPGKSGLSTGISALKTVLDKFSVSNRNNMFVYQDSDCNVFYLRLQENYNYYRNSQMKYNEFENVSRSPSVASLPLGHQKGAMPSTGDNCITCPAADLRPRVRSFGEKETKEEPQEDTIVLKVHGITETGQDIRCQLVQVLQNRLDDAVLDFLSLTLERNSMCPLTPEDVRFLQKPFRPPEQIVRFSLQTYSLKYSDAFVYYLRQNLLQYLNIPKYTDSRQHYHFKDYSECDQCNIVTEDNIFIYNQSPITGSKGISVIALAFIDYLKDGPKDDVNFENIFSKGTFYDMVDCYALKADAVIPSTYLEFRLWNQGRVNTESLHQKLHVSSCQAHWDILTEYYLLTKQLCVKSYEMSVRQRRVQTRSCGEITEERKQVILDASIKISNTKPRIINYELKFDKLPSQTYRKRFTESLSVQKFFVKDFSKDLWKNTNLKPLVKMDSLELGDSGSLSNVYLKTLPDWLEFSITMGVPSVKKIILNICNQHSLTNALKELQGVIMSISQDEVKIFVYYESKNVHEPFSAISLSNEYLLIARNFDHWKLYQNENLLIQLMKENNLNQMLKFVPAIINCKFIPRQKILWANVGSKEIILYTYNWSKDNVDKLTEQASNLSMWLSVRGCLQSSIIAQKLGLFNGQAITRKPIITTNNPYVNCICEIDLMSKFPRERTRRSANSSATMQSFLDSFRDTYRIISPYMDSVVTNMLEMIEIKQSDKRHRDDLKTLYSMYQSRSSNATSSQMQILMQNSRNIHYCHTPLLFLPRWRIKAARTRDHTIVPMGDNTIDVNLDDENETWHQELCTYFISEYKHYLQTLGFMSLQIQHNDRRNVYENIHFMQKALLGGILIFTIELKEPFLITKLHAIEYNRLHVNTTRAAINQFMQSFLDECDKVKFIMHLHSFTYDFHLRCVCNYVSENHNSKLKDGYYITDFLNDFMKYYSKAPNYARNLVYTDTVKMSNLLTDGKQLYNFLLAHIKQYQFKHIIMKDSKISDETEYILVQTTNTPQLSYKDSQDRQHTDDFDVTSIVTDISPRNDDKHHNLHMKYYLILTSRREKYPKYENERKLGKFRTVTSLEKNRTERVEDQMDINIILNNDLIEQNNKTNEGMRVENKLVNVDESGEKQNDEEETSRDEIETNNERKETNKNDDEGNENEENHPEEVKETQECSSNSSGEHSDASPSQTEVVNKTNDESITKKTEEEKKHRPHVEIRQESVNYLGYYSSHEQLMQQLILDCATSTETRLREMAAQGTIHCRTHILWNRLLSAPESNKMSFQEFTELKALAKVENLAEAHPRLGSLFKEPIQWYQDLAKLLVAKYSEHYRVYSSPDGSVHHYVVLHHRYSGAFMLLSLDMDISRGSICIVNRPTHDYEESDICLKDRSALINSFINCVCFYIWSNMI